MAITRQTILKALTVKQPWASLIMSGIKQIENRSWKPRVNVGERFVIHAGSGVADAKRIPKEFLATLPDERPKMLALGTVILMGYHLPGEDCDERCEVFGVPDAGYHWELGSPEWFDKPIQIQGKLGMWPISVE
ncbi:ASCH domain-containing protein [Schaalia sp. lx-100]|uniref:ASCH domain-containing protein n=1 Tax=Schaalia sp. lx-100 TaxID=2899081 RepID=UPI001E2A4F14|nr:ASCH domain-containing protein [Schaalia sp. lx-100]